MSYNITDMGVKTLSLRISYANYCKWKDSRLPESNPLNSLTRQDFLPDGAEDDPANPTYIDPETMADIEVWLWSNEGSGRDYYDVLPNFAADLEGHAEFIVTWEGGDSVTGLIIRNGKAAEASVRFEIDYDSAKLIGQP